MVGTWITWHRGRGAPLTLGTGVAKGMAFTGGDTQGMKQIPAKTLVGDGGVKLCVKAGKGRGNMRWDFLLTAIGGVRRMRQGNSCRHLVLHYCRMLQGCRKLKKKRLLYYFLNFCSLHAWLWLGLRESWGCGLWLSSEGGEKQEGSAGMWYPGFGTLPMRKSTVPCPVDPCHQVFCHSQGLNCNRSPGASPTEHLLLWGCAWKSSLARSLNPVVSPEKNPIWCNVAGEAATTTSWSS